MVRLGQNRQANTKEHKENMVGPWLVHGWFMVSSWYNLVVNGGSWCKLVVVGILGGAISDSQELIHSLK